MLRLGWGFDNLTFATYLIGLYYTGFNKVQNLNTSVLECQCQAKYNPC